MSEKTVVQKLRLKEGQTFMVLDAPEGFNAKLPDVPEGVEIATDSSGRADVILCFVSSMARLQEVLPRLRDVLTPKGVLWIAYPKGTSKVETDLNRDIIWEYTATVGLAAVSIFSIDSVWSALRLKPS